MHTNAIQARVAMRCLVHAAAIYTTSVPVPKWDADDLKEARKTSMDAGANITDTAIGIAVRHSLMNSTSTALSTHRHSSGWEIVGLATR